MKISHLLTLAASLITALFAASCRTIEEEPTPEPKPLFSITTKEVTETGFIMNISPADREMGYVAMTATESQYENYASEQEVIDATIGLFRQYADYYRYSLEEFLDASGVLKRGEATLKFSAEPDTGYVLYVFGISDDGVPLTGLNTLTIKTAAVEMNGMTFSISCDVDGPEVSATVKPSIPDQTYVFTIITTEALHTAESPEAYMEEMISTQISYGEAEGASREEAVSEISWTGDQTFPVTLNASTAYSALACSVTAEGLINSDVAVHEFSTGPVKPSDNMITLEVSSINVNSVYLKATVTNSDQYVIVLDEAKYWKDLSEEDALALLKSEFELEDGINSGSVEFPVEGLSENTEYVAMAIGYYAGDFTTGLTSITFCTLEAGDPTGMTFDISVDEITQSGVTIDITGNPENALYYWNVCAADMSSEEIRTELDELIDSYIAYGYIRDRSDFMAQEGSRGHENYRYTGLESGRDYIVYAVGVYADGSYATEFFRSEAFRMQDQVLTDAAVTIGYDKYFDGDAIAAAYPQFADWAGNAVLPISASLSGSAASYRYSVYLGNLTDASRYSDNLITEDLIKNGYSTPNQVFLCDFGVEMTMLAVAFDPDGNPGQVFRRSFSLDRSGISPAEEFDPSLWTTSGRSSAKKASPGIKRPEMPERHAEKIPVRRSKPHKILMLTDTH